LLLDVARPLLPSIPGLSAQETERVERDLAAFLADEIAAMPAHLRVPFRLGLIAFAILPLLRFGRTYRALPADLKRRVVYAWANSPIGAFRNFVKLVRSCALFAYLDHPIVMAQLERESGASDLASGDLASSHAG
jgi:hypothetical protein